MDAVHTYTMAEGLLRVKSFKFNDEHVFGGGEGAGGKIIEKLASYVIDNGW